jgi:hypothetical protein
MLEPLPDRKFFKIKSKSLFESMRAGAAKSMKRHGRSTPVTRKGVGTTSKPCSYPINRIAQNAPAADVALTNVSGRLMGLIV